MSCRTASCRTASCPIARTVLVAVLCATLGAIPATRADAQASNEGRSDFAAPGRYDEQIRPLFAKYCFECHVGDLAQAGVTLDVYREADAKTRDRAIWQKVMRQLQGKVMPPEDAAQPTAEERARLVAWIDAYALTPDCSGPQRPGRVTLRRLNRAEYNNTVRDLFGITIQPADDFPSDDVGYGFDNIGDVLTLPPVLLERYVDAADRVVRAAILTPDLDGAPSKAGAGGQLASVGEVAMEIDFPATADYLLRAHAGADQAGPDPARMTFRLDGKDQKTFDVMSTRNEPQWYELRLRIERGKHRFAAAFINDYYMPDATDPKLKGDRNLVVERLAIVGPIGVLPEDLPESQRRIFTQRPAANADLAAWQAAAKGVLKPIVTRVFRRPVQDEELDRLVQLVAVAKEQGDSFERAIQLALQATLVSPHFLFRIETEAAPGEVRKLNDYELASRLSYFLWSSLPDEELFRAAEAGELQDGEQLARQARRMLQDPKASALVENFAGQWLQLRNLETFSPDLARFPGFDDELRQAFRQETEQFFSHIMNEDRSVLELLQADYTFVNERLAKHYGMAGVSGAEFRRVLVDPAQRGGLLGQSSILAVTSNPTRTSPVKRGKWILENLFAAPPPPPPPNVPELAEAKDQPLKGTLRQRMEQHRVKPACASCHQLMDPLGFGLENYDAVGAWRTKDGEEEVDASGELPDGKTFRGPAELKVIMLARQDEFRRCLAEKMLTYALGRGLEYYDACLVKQIADELARHDNRFSILITQIVQAPAFRSREGLSGL
jgi:hypothetical protein